MSTAKRRVAILAAAYAGLVIVALLSWLTTHVYVGALAVIPMLYISYYVRPWAALVTAFIAGAVVALLNADMLPSSNVIQAPPLVDVLTLSLALCASVAVSLRLRDISVANELLHGSLLKARRAAERDTLTGLVNRAYFLQALTEAAHHAKPGQRSAVLFCDLDGFKPINDTYGHLIGDNVLRMAAGRLVNTVRAVDVVARLGGDEFGVLVRVLHDGPDEASHMAANIVRAFENPFHLGDERYAVGITIGISVCPDDGAEPEMLVRVADARMYAAKAQKRTRSVI